MRKLRYQVATSLDGYLAAPGGAFDWIPMDPDIDFAALISQFDTAVMGRKTFLAGMAHGGLPLADLKVVVYSRTLQAVDYPSVTLINGDPVEHMRSLQAAPGKDIWLYGGGELFRTFAGAGIVDTVEPAVVPVLLGDGIPMLAPPHIRMKLSLTGQRLYSKSGILLLSYDVLR
ncbi:MAG: dihydrofolate reductase [Bryobacterales bacterium]|nr:dihydrofolate reductase [Bryobacterales bacterium]